MLKLDICGQKGWQEIIYVKNQTLLYKDKWYKQAENDFVCKNCKKKTKFYHL